MNFQQQLQQQLGSVKTGDFDNSNRPDKQLKHPKLYFDKNTTTLMLRILPPMAPDKQFAEGFRSIFLKTYTDAGKEVPASMQMSLAPDINSPLENAINDWSARGLLPNPFSKNGAQQKPSARFLVNAVQVQLDPQTGSFQYETDPVTKELVVHVVELPQSAFAEIGAKLQDPAFAPPQGQEVPPEVAQYSFISESNAYALQIVKPAKNSGKMSYDVNVMQSVQLGALPQGWQALCEDLALQAQPTEQHSADFVTNFIGWFNARSGGGAPQAQNAFGQQPNFGQQPSFGQQPNFGQPAQQQGFQQPAQQQGFGQQPNFGQPAQQGFQQPAQQGFQQQQPAQQGFQQQQAPVQQGFQQQAPVQQQQPAQQGFQQQAPVQQQYTPQQAVADVAPANEQQNMQQPVQNQAPVQQPAQQVEQGAESVPPQPSAIPDINSLLSSMQGSQG